MAVVLATVVVMVLRGDALERGPLAGTWVLNAARSHYGGGAQPRRWEIMRCSSDGPMVECTISSERIDGRHLTGHFRAAYDGKPYPADGIPDVDHVSLEKVDEDIVVATFLSGGRRVFGYRAIRSTDGRTLTVVSVDPQTQRVLTSVVVYERPASDGQHR